ncbi:MAG TPA: 1-deoxy-D-xylulose-5-phosphate synthase, partial [Kandleria vitulina]|nr:1-deoxy-D-xylulose-5-phosphate synthase [Kandleria vitulina]
MNIKEIDNPKQIKQLSINELEHLSQDIRTFIMENVSKTGGHFSSNLGITDLTVALHYVFDSPKDKFIFDVGHQSYVHKILTGRAKDFSTLRQYNGLSGFQRRHESEHDPWEAGHSSTSISGATGIAIARDLNKEDFQVIAIIGDAAILSGESLEALNYLGSSNTKVIVILNDNDMSISKNVGGLSKALSDIRVSKQYNEAKDNYTQFMMKTKAGKEIYKATKKVKDKIKHRVMIDSLFQQFGIDYLGPVDGHDMGELINALTTAKKLDHSVILHVKTIKGKGYPRAEQDKIGLYHGVPPFDLKKGILNKTNTHSQKWSEAIANHIEYMMGKHDDICVITPAMISGSQLNHIFKSYPNRSFDVGIAEEHAMTFLAGLSVGGKFPFLSIY